MKRRGFTILEIIITITIMSVLMLLSTVAFNSTMVSSRDSKRKEDVTTLALQIESYYNSGNDNDSTIGQYPSVDPTNPLTDGDKTTNSNETSMLRNLDVVNLVAPSSTANVLSSLIPAANAVQTVAGVLPQPTISEYVYQPIASDGTLCDDISTKNCTKFNIYYMTESDNTVMMVTSRHQ